MKYLAIVSIWLFCYFAPAYAGPWWDQHYNLYQSAVSLAVMIAVLRLTTDWWRAEMATLCVLQVTHNCSDILFNFPPANFNQIQDVLNMLEFVLLFGAGGITQLIKAKYGRDSNPNSTRGPDDAVQNASSRWRDA